MTRPPWLAEIQRHPKLAGVEVLVQTGVFWPRLGILVWPNGAGGVEVARRFDAHHGGAIIGQEARRRRPSDGPHEIENPDVRKWPIVCHQITPSAWS